ncbi:MAG: lipopolysaccharide biosynthesis protein, partial [Nanoarchaeota archaeon]
MELKKRIMHGLLWNSFASLGIQTLNFVTKILIARILFPEDFGLFAMAFLLINFLSIFIGFGIMNAVINKKEEYEKTKGTALVLSMVTGIFLFVISFISSNFIADFFNQPLVGSMIKVLSMVLLFDSVSSILHGILLKELEFKKKAVAEFFSVVFSSATVIVLAVYGFGVWSLVWAYIVQHFSILFFSWMMIKEKPKLFWDKEITRELLCFGKHILSISIVSWIVTSIDNIVVGKRLGDEPLGYYSMAFNLVALPVSSFTHLIMTVFYPIYAKLENDKERLKKAYLKPLEWSLVVMLPIAVFLFFIPEKIVIVILGQKW